MTARLWKVGLAGSGLTLYAGACVGGSTVINDALCFRPPGRLLEVWQDYYDLPGLGAEGMEPYVNRVWEDIHAEPTGPDHTSRNAARLALGAQRLGWMASATPRSVRNCVNLGLCNFGCPSGAKQSTLVTYVPRAERRRRARARAHARGAHPDRGRRRHRRGRRAARPDHRRAGRARHDRRAARLHGRRRDGDAGAAAAQRRSRSHRGRRRRPQQHARRGALRRAGERILRAHDGLRRDGVRHAPGPDGARRHDREHGHASAGDRRCHPGHGRRACGPHGPAAVPRQGARPGARLRARARSGRRHDQLRPSAPTTWHGSGSA